MSFSCAGDRVDGSLDRCALGRAPAAERPQQRPHLRPQLRKALGNGRLETHGRGYLLALEPEQLDLGRFERLLGDGRSCSPRARLTARPALRAALGLWRGPPLSDVAFEPFAQAEIARLDELRLAALEERIEADLAPAATPSSCPSSRGSSASIRCGSACAPS